ncbi:MAG: EF-hand domain-containing protein, partial [Cyanobacteria bacterium NC_groundwater_1444_Ag_S-0.65um_54_12]|nr:EF-hand domain-containing protein [Cyanobacteria bacterium NC_groundwater_1444_Ag_S-0.65um_54_12]
YMQYMDKNGDGVITPDEQPNQDFFDKLDLNKDGKVTYDELANPKLLADWIAAIREQAVTWTKYLDRDGNKQLGLTEFKGVWITGKQGPVSDPAPIIRKHFTRSDKNRNGFLSRAELESWFGSLLAAGYGYGVEFGNP